MRREHRYATGLVATVLASFAVLVVGQPPGGDPAARVAALRTRVASVTGRITHVDDINRIENLQGSYGYYTDKIGRAHV